jgi:hypothetical protein
VVSWLPFFHDMVLIAGILLPFRVAAIAGQLNTQNLHYFGSLLAMGIRAGTPVRMVLVQGAVVASLGYCLGLGGAPSLTFACSPDQAATRKTLAGHDLRRVGRRRQGYSSNYWQ